MLKNSLLLLCILLASVCFAQTEQLFTPKTKQLIEYTKSLIYTSDYASAQEAVDVYLGEEGLSVEEEFYGYFLEADITKAAGDPDLAISMLLSASKLLVQVEGEKRQLYRSLLYGNIAECYFNKLDYKNAKKNALHSIRLHEGNDLKSNGHAINYLILGYTHRLAGELQKAINYYHAAINSYKSTQNTCELPLCYTKIADLHLLQQEYAQAEYYINLSSSISDSCSIDQYRLLSLLTRVNLFEQQGHFEKAYRSMRKVEQLRQKVLKSQQLKLVSDLQIKHQTALANAENLQLKETAKIVKENTTFKFILLSGSLIALLLLLLFVALLLKVRQQKNKELQKQLTKINQQNKEREALLKEVHHRVKNNMQVITSLLHLQAHDTNKSQEDLSSMFQSSQNRINAMALVHEMLYQSEDVSTISLAAYLKDLVESLYKGLRKGTQNIHFDLQISNISMGLDTAIPLGLLLNEILSNALLHGFDQQNEGTVYVYVEQLRGNHYQLSIGDNGIGIKNCEGAFKNQSLGFSLIHKLVRQLQGNIQLLDRSEGCHYQIEFKAVD